MASASAAKPTKGAPAAATKTADTSDVQVSAPSRREFLYYIWGASIALFLGQTTVGLLLFAYPRFKEGEFGGVFTVVSEEIPETGAPPVSKPAGRFWLSNNDEGFTALYGVCTHLGCLPKWVDTNGRFECPCHGSKFTLDGTYIEGPAPRNLDRFQTTIVFTDGTTAETNDDGDPIPLNGRTIREVRVNTGARILGERHT
jgi:cytochrome b6-f complex iron-sulfur subunit